MAAVVLFTFEARCLKCASKFNRPSSIMLRYFSLFLTRIRSPSMDIHVCGTRHVRGKPWNYMASVFCVAISS